METRTKPSQPCLSEFSVGIQTEIHVDPVLPAITVSTVELLLLRGFLSLLYLFILEINVKHFQPKIVHQ